MTFFKLFQVIFAGVTVGSACYFAGLDFTAAYGFGLSTSAILIAIKAQ